MLDAVHGADVGAPYGAPPLARSLLHEVSTEPDRLRIAFTARPLLGRTAPAHDDCVNALHATVSLLQELGHQPVEADPQVDGEACAVSFLTIVAAEARADIERTARMARHAPSAADFEASTYAAGLLGKAISASDYVNASRVLQAAARQVGRFFEQYDVLLTPTLAQPAVPIGALKASAGELALVKLVGRLNAGWLLDVLGAVKPFAARAFDFAPYTPLFNVTGQPAMSVPLWWNQAGLPIGMQFVGRFGDEATLFRLAGQLERTQPWFDRLPTM